MRHSKFAKWTKQLCQFLSINPSISPMNYSSHHRLLPNGALSCTSFMSVRFFEWCAPEWRFLREKKTLIEQPQAWGFIFPCFFFRNYFNTGITPYISPSNILRPVCFLICKCFRDRSSFCRCVCGSTCPTQWPASPVSPWGAQTSL